MWVNDIPKYIENRYSKYRSSINNPTTKFSGNIPTAMPGDSVYYGSVVDLTYFYVDFRLYNCYFKVFSAKNYIMKEAATKWHQNAPFNNQVAFFPSSCNRPNQRGYAGCGIIAIAQIMAANNYPTGYNWSLLKSNPLITTSSSDVARANEVSRLIKDIHSVIKPSIQCDGTSVSTVDVQNTLKKYGFSCTLASSDLVEYFNWDSLNY